MWKKYFFTWNFLAIALLTELLWFFLLWILMQYTRNAMVIMTFTLPVVGAVYLFLPQERRDRCTAADLKIIKNIARIAFGCTALFAGLMLSGLYKHLPQEFVIEQQGLFYLLLAQFALHVFAMISFTGLALLAPKEQRRKPLQLVLAIYIISTLMQLTVFPATLMILRELTSYQPSEIR